MRDIKFRAWIQREKKLCIVNELRFDDFSNVHKIGWFTKKTGELLFQDAIGHECSFIDLMQYTGLRDKNRKEIYEGDIIKYQKVEGFDYEDKYEEIEKVIFINGAFEPVYLSKRDFHTYDDELIVVEDLEVIGNIYENPDLLKV